MTFHQRYHSNCQAGSGPCMEYHVHTSRMLKINLANNNFIPLKGQGGLKHALRTGDVSDFVWNPMVDEVGSLPLIHCKSM